MHEKETKKVKQTLGFNDVKIRIGFEPKKVQTNISEGT